MTLQEIQKNITLDPSKILQYQCKICGESMKKFWLYDFKAEIWSNKEKNDAWMEENFKKHNCFK